MKKTIRRLIGALILLTLASFFFSLYYWADGGIIAKHGYERCFLAGCATTMCIVFLLFVLFFFALLVRFALNLIFD